MKLLARHHQLLAITIFIYFSATTTKSNSMNNKCDQVLIMILCLLPKHEITHQKIIRNYSSRKASTKHKHPMPRMLSHFGPRNKSSSSFLLQVNIYDPQQFKGKPLDESGLPLSLSIFVLKIAVLYLS